MINSRSILRRMAAAVKAVETGLMSRGDFERLMTRLLYLYREWSK